MPVNMIQGIAYVLCSTLAAFGGIMISAQVNGAFLGLGDPYLLEKEFDSRRMVGMSRSAAS